MTKSRRLLAGLGLAATVLPATPASAEDVPFVLGQSCGMAAPPALDSLRRGVIGGGPVYGGSLGKPVASVYLLCTVQVGGNATHAAPDAQLAISWGIGVTATAAVASFTAASATPVYLCTEVWVDTGKGHVSVYLDGATGQYSYSASVPCHRTTSGVLPGRPSALAPQGEPGVGEVGEWKVGLQTNDEARLCGFASASDPTGEENVQTGVIGGGPLVLGDDTDPTVTYTGSITCTIQVGANSTHAGTDAFTVTGPTAPAVAVLPETQASYEAAGPEPVYLCSQVNIEGGPTLYFDESNDPLVDGEWSASPTAGCALAISG